MDNKKAGGVAAPHGLVSDFKKIAPVSYQALTKTATEDLDSNWRSIGELSREIVVNCFNAKYRIRPELGAAIFELANLGRRAA